MEGLTESVDVAVLAIDRTMIAKNGLSVTPPLRGCARTRRIAARSVDDSNTRPCYSRGSYPLALGRKGVVIPCEEEYALVGASLDNVGDAHAPVVSWIFGGVVVTELKREIGQVVVQGVFVQVPVCDLKWVIGGERRSVAADGDGAIDLIGGILEIAAECVAVAVDVVFPDGAMETKVADNVGIGARDISQELGSGDIGAKPPNRPYW